MGTYGNAAEFYDLLYAAQKDYAAEARALAQLIREENPHVRSLLDVGCGTGAHARCLLDLGFEVDGLDVEPAFVEIARRKCPEGGFHMDDMRTFDIGRRYDAVLCLFSAIGYVRDLQELAAALTRMAEHTNPGGVVIVDPWFEPGELTHGWIMTLTAESDGLSVCRMSRTLVEGSTSRLEFEYLIGSRDGIEHRSEVHELALFTQQEMEAAFEEAGLRVRRIPEMLRTRGVYIGVR